MVPQVLIYLFTTSVVLCALENEAEVYYLVSSVISKISQLSGRDTNETPHNANYPSWWCAEALCNLLKYTNKVFEDLRKKTIDCCNDKFISVCSFKVTLYQHTC